jgi:hypothetical protein
MYNPVSHPAHYTAGKIECIDAIEAALGRQGMKAFLTGQCLKYLWRHELKHENPDIDLRKCRFYLDRLIEMQQPAAPAPAEPS